MNNQGKGRKLQLTGGLVLLGFGLILVFWPEFAIHVFPPIIGLVLLLVGIEEMVHLILHRTRIASPPLKLAQSLVHIMVALVFLLKRGPSFPFFEVLLSLYVLFSAILHLSLVISALQNRLPFLLELLESILQLVLGLLLLLTPFSSTVLWVRILGIHFLVAGGNAVLSDWPPRKPEETKPEQTAAEPPEPQ